MKDLDPSITMFLYPLLNNLYFVHEDIVAVCSKWIPRREAHDEKMWLATQLQREVAELPMYWSRIHAVGHKPDPQLRINDSKVRYRLLRETDDDLEVVIGMNVVAQGALGIIEHEQLYAFSPGLLMGFYDAMAGMKHDLEFAKLYLSRRDPARVDEMLARYYRHLLEQTVPEIEPLLEPLAQRGIVSRDIIEQGRLRYLQIVRSLGRDADTIVRLSTDARAVLS